jgi:hypothetical protein
VSAGGVHHRSPRRRSWVAGEAQETNMYAKAVRIDMCGLLVYVCELMLGVGMTDERKNVDAWDMERRTESAAPSMV